MREVLVGKKYRHFKGKIMEVLYIGKDSETLKNVVIYKHLDDDVIWVRDYDMFNSLVDKEKYPEVTQKYRFELVDEL